MSHSRLIEWFRARRKKQGLTDGSKNERKAKRLQHRYFYNLRYYDKDSSHKIRSSLPVTLPKRRENRFASSRPYKRDQNDSNVAGKTKASATSWPAEDFACRRCPSRVNRDSYLQSRESAKGDNVASWESQARSHRVAPDEIAKSTRNEPRKTHRFCGFYSDLPGHSLQNTSWCHTTPKTTKHELSYPLIASGVEVVYTTDVSEAKTWLKTHIRNCSARTIGFDIEWKPQFVSKKDGGTQNKTAVIQLAVEDSCLVLHIHYMSRLPKLLKSILRDEEILKVGSGIRQDGLKLERDRGLALKGLEDIQLIATQLDPAMPKTGIKALADRFLGIELNKVGAISNWENFPLEVRQIEYAALDAWVGLKIFHEMKR